MTEDKILAPTPHYFNPNAAPVTGSPNGSVLIDVGAITVTEAATNVEAVSSTEATIDPVSIVNPSDLVMPSAPVAVAEEMLEALALPTEVAVQVTTDEIKVEPVVAVAQPVVETPSTEAVE